MIKSCKNIYFTVVVLARQSLDLAEKCLDSISWQVGSVKKDIIYVDDNSGYNIRERKKLRKMVEKVSGEIFFSEKRQYQIGSLASTIHKIKDQNSIVCLVDGDDYLMPDALLKVYQAYQNPEIVMSYGNTIVDFRPYQDCMQEYFSDKSSVNTSYPKDVWKNRSFRQDGFRCFHLRTFRRWLWNYIDPSSFLRANGEHFHASGDSSFIFPMLELLSDPKHVAFIQDPIYAYRLYGGNVHNYDKKSQFDDLEFIRFSQKPYPRLDQEILNQHISEH